LSDGWKPRHNPWLIAITVTLATFMEVLDTSIANVSLPHIAGSLSASNDEATWVITSYLVSNAIVLPASSYLSSLIGRKRFYMICVALFGISSALCGLAPNLNCLLFFRVLQGIGGGGLGPSEQAILADTFPPSQRGKAFALYGLAVVCAPAIGPTLGGYITDNYDWRWIFFINVPVAILSLYLTSVMVEDPPAQQKETAELKKQGFNLDYVGFAFLALAFGSLEVLLDKGQEDDWFGSRLIVFFAITTVVGFIGLFSWELHQIAQDRKPILNLKLFLNRTFSLSFVMMFILGVALYGTTVLIPQFLQTMMGYTAETAGFALSYGGLMTMACMPLVGISMGKIDPRYLVAFGFTVTGISLIHMSGLNLEMSFSHAAWMRVYQAAGIAFLFVPIQTMSYSDLPAKYNNDISGLTNLARNVGGSFGTSIVVTLLARRSQVHQSYLGSHITGSSQLATQRLAAIGQNLSAAGYHPNEVALRASAQLYHQLGAQAQLLAYIDIIEVFAIGSLLMVPLAFFMQPTAGGEVQMH
jgi:DHA2 family multidrug resistance protein